MAILCEFWATAASSARYTQILRKRKESLQLWIGIGIYVQRIEITLLRGCHLRPSVQFRALFSVARLPARELHAVSAISGLTVQFIDDATPRSRQNRRGKLDKTHQQLNGLHRVIRRSGRYRCLARCLNDAQRMDGAKLAKHGGPGQHLGRAAWRAKSKYMHRMRIHHLHPREPAQRHHSMRIGCHNRLA